MTGRLTLQHLLDEARQPADNVGIDVSMSIAYRPLQGWFLEVEWETEDDDADLRMELAAQELVLEKAAAVWRAAARAVDGPLSDDERSVLKNALADYEQVAA